MRLVYLGAICVFTILNISIWYASHADVMKIERMWRRVSVDGTNSTYQPGNTIRRDGESPIFNKMMTEMIELEKKQVSARQSKLRGPTGYADLFGSLGTEVLCPEKVRIGVMGDGGKWMCNPWKIPDDCTVVSLGLNNQVDFDTSLQGLLNNRCKLFGYDADEQTADTQEKYKKLNGKTRKAFITTIKNETAHQYTIEDLMELDGVKDVEILKIDIEGAEKTALIPFLQKYTVCQIIIEVHGRANEHSSLLNKIAKQQYRLFSYEVNGFDMAACEYSFIHETCVDKYGGKRIVNYLDF